MTASPLASLTRGELEYQVIEADRRSTLITATHEGRVLERSRVNLDDLRDRERLAENLAARHEGPAYLDDLRDLAVLVAETRIAGKSPLRIIELAEIEEPPPRVWRIADLIPDGMPMILYGDGGQGKSYLALGAAMAVASGRAFLDLAVARSNVLYLDWELDAEEFSRRAFHVARGLGLLRPPAGLFYARATTPLADCIEDIRQACAQRRCGLLVIDSFGAACGGDSQSERTVIPVMQAVRALNVATMIVDHQAKRQMGHDYAQKTPYGNAYKFNLARAVWQLERGERGIDGEAVALLRHVKSNFGPLCPEIGVRLAFDPSSRGLTVRMSRINPTEVPELVDKLTALDRVRAELRDSEDSSPVEIAEATSIPEGTVRNCLTKLRRSNKAESQDGRWRLKFTNHDPYKGNESGIVSDARPGRIAEQALALGATLITPEGDGSTPR